MIYFLKIEFTHNYLDLAIFDQDPEVGGGSARVCLLTDRQEL